MQWSLPIREQAVLTSALVANGSLVSGNVNGDNSFVAVLGAELQNVVGPLEQAVDAAKYQTGLGRGNNIDRGAL